MINKFNMRKMKHLKMVDKLLSFFIRTKKNNAPINWKDIKQIAILDPTLIGDIIMLIPFLQILRKNAPKASITLICGKWGKDILEDQNLIDKFIILNDVKTLSSIKLFFKNIKNIKSIINIINNIKYDIVLEPRGDIRYILFMHFIKAIRKASYNYTGGECMLTDVVIPSDTITHLIEDKLYFLEFLGCSVKDESKIPRLFLNENQKIENQKFIKNYGLENCYVVGINPGASMKIKQWTKFDELILLLAKKNNNCIFLIFEGPNENDIIIPLIRKADEYKIKYIIVNESLINYIRLLAVCNHVICNDSSAGHISAALGVPVTIIYGSTSSELACPFGLNIINIVSHSINCKPCLSSDCLTGTYECLYSIEAEEVINKIN